MKRLLTLLFLVACSQGGGSGGGGFTSFSSSSFSSGGTGIGGGAGLPQKAFLLPMQKTQSGANFCLARFVVTSNTAIQLIGITGHFLSSNSVHTKFTYSASFDGKKKSSFSVKNNLNIHMPLYAFLAPSTDYVVEVLVHLSSNVSGDKLKFVLEEVEFKNNTLQKPFIVPEILCNEQGTSLPRINSTVASIPTVQNGPRILLYREYWKDFSAQPQELYDVTVKFHSGYKGGAGNIYMHGSLELVVDNVAVDEIPVSGHSSGQIFKLFFFNRTVFASSTSKVEVYLKKHNLAQGDLFVLDRMSYGTSDGVDLGFSSGSLISFY